MELDKAWNNLRNVEQISSGVSNVEHIESEMGNEAQLNSAIDAFVEIMSTYTGLSTDNIDVNIDNRNRTISATIRQVQYASRLDFPSVGSTRLLYIDLSDNSIWIYDENNGYVCVGNDTMIDNTSVVDQNKIAHILTINGDYDADTNRLATENDLPKNTSELTNDGDGESPFATEEYVSIYGGKIDSISVNGVPQTIDENKNVDIPDTGATSVGLRTGDTGNAVTNMSYDPSTRKITFEKGDTFVRVSDIDNALNTQSSNPVQNRVIAELVPNQASANNQLADKNFVNSSIATSTATFRGTYNVVTDLSLTINATEQEVSTALSSVISTADANDYCYVQFPRTDAEPTVIVRYDRYKYNESTGTFAFEFSLNNSSFTASQWAAINSGATEAGITASNNTTLQINAEYAEITRFLAEKGISTSDTKKISYLTEYIYNNKQDTLASYLKDASVDGNNLTITKGDNTQIVFQGGSDLDNTTIVKNANDELQAVGITDGTTPLLYSTIYEAITTQWEV